MLCLIVLCCRRLYFRKYSVDLSTLRQNDSDPGAGTLGAASVGGLFHWGCAGHSDERAAAGTEANVMN